MPNLQGPQPNINNTFINTNHLQNPPSCAQTLWKLADLTLGRKGRLVYRPNLRSGIDRFVKRINAAVNHTNNASYKNSYRDARKKTPSADGKIIDYVLRQISLRLNTVRRVPSTCYITINCTVQCVYPDRPTVKLYTSTFIKLIITTNCSTLCY